MGFGAALLLLALGSPNVFDQFDKPWDRDWHGKTPIYFGKTAEGQFYVTADEVKRETGGEVSFWMHGEHAMVPNHRYATSLWHVWLDCRGKYGTDASTTFDATGAAMFDWDGSRFPMHLIRPGTIYQKLETILCKAPGSAK